MAGKLSTSGSDQMDSSWPVASKLSASGLDRMVVKSVTEWSVAVAVFLRLKPVLALESSLIIKILVFLVYTLLAKSRSSKANRRSSMVP